MNFRDIVDLFVLLHFWLCSASVLMVIASAMVLQVELRTIGLGVLLPALLMCVVYVEDRRSPDPADRINQPRRTALVDRYQRALFLTVIVAMGGYQVLLIHLVHATAEIGPIYLLLGQFPFVVLVGYQHLKGYPGLDSLVVGCTWAYAIVFTVVVATGISLSSRLVLVFLVWVLLVAAGAESRNIRDRTGDRMSGHTTLAIWFGASTIYLLEAVLKTIGVVVFWITGGVQAAATLFLWLALLRVFRYVEHRRASTP